MVASMTEQNAEDGLAELEALPGGARAALEAVLMVIDEPATSEELAVIRDYDPQGHWRA